MCFHDLEHILFNVYSWGFAASKNLITADHYKESKSSKRVFDWDSISSFLTFPRAWDIPKEPPLSFPSSKADGLPFF